MRRPRSGVKMNSDHKGEGRSGEDCAKRYAGDPLTSSPRLVKTAKVRVCEINFWCRTHQS